MSDFGLALVPSVPGTKRRTALASATRPRALSQTLAFTRVNRPVSSGIEFANRTGTLIVEAGKIGYVYAMDAVLPSDERFSEPLLS